MPSPRRHALASDSFPALLPVGLAYARFGAWGYPTTGLTAKRISEAGCGHRTDMDLEAETAPRSQL